MTDIRETERRTRRGAPSQQISITAGKTYNLAGGVKQERLQYLLLALRQKWRQSRR